MPNSVHLITKDLESIADTFVARSIDAAGRPLTRAAALNIIARAILGPRHDWGAIKAQGDAPIVSQRARTILAESKEPESHRRRLDHDIDETFRVAEIRGTRTGLHIDLNDPETGRIIAVEVPSRCLLAHRANGNFLRDVSSPQTSVEIRVLDDRSIRVTYTQGYNQIINTLEKDEYLEACSQISFPAETHSNTGYRVGEVTYLEKQNQIRFGFHFPGEETDEPARHHIALCSDRVIRALSRELRKECPADGQMILESDKLEIFRAPGNMIIVRAPAVTNVLHPNELQDALRQFLQANPAPEGKAFAPTAGREIAFARAQKIADGIDGSEFVHYEKLFGVEAIVAYFTSDRGLRSFGQSSLIHGSGKNGGKFGLIIRLDGTIPRDDEATEMLGIANRAKRS